MLLFYFGYTLLWNHRLNMSEHWQSRNFLTEGDFETITRFGKLTDGFEVMFYILFALISIVYFFRINKDRKDSSIVKQYFFGHTFLFITVVALSFIISLITNVPIYNLLSLLFLPISIFVVFLSYMLFGLIKLRLAN